MKSMIKKVNNFAIWMSNKLKPVSVLLTFITFATLLITIGLIPYAIKSIYIPISHSYTQSNMQVIDKFDMSEEIRVSKNRLTISYTYVTDGTIKLRVPIKVWNECNYGDSIKYYSYGDINQYYELKFSNGIFILLFFIISLFWIMFGLAGFGISDKKESKNANKMNRKANSLDMNNKTLLSVSFNIITYIIMIFIAFVLIMQAYRMMDQFIF